MMDRHTHWKNVYNQKDHTRVSWYQADCAGALAEIKLLNLPKNAAIIDIGGGASRLVDSLLSEGFKALTVLDIAEQSLKIAQQRLAQNAAQIHWISADIIQTELPKRYDLWHDRAAFHFLTNPADQQRYLTALRNHLNPGAYVMLATFAKGGPEKCSDLMVEQYDAAKMTKTLGPRFELLKSYQTHHETPGGSSQLFQHCIFKFNG